MGRFPNVGKPEFASQLEPAEAVEAHMLGTHRVWDRLADWQCADRLAHFGAP